ncbi:hypothetical protein [Georgenia satyanarayanai]|nr:hypothetical protein [Georgenia satyanarayanai]
MRRRLPRWVAWAVAGVVVAMVVVAVLLVAAVVSLSGDVAGAA